MCSTPPTIPDSDQLPRVRLLVLGAGFSHAAGLPLGDELWRLTRERALEGPGAEKFRMDLDMYLNYRRECDGVVLDPGEVDYEDFLGNKATPAPSTASGPPSQRSSARDREIGASGARRAIL